MHNDAIAAALVVTALVGVVSTSFSQAHNVQQSSPPVASSPDAAMATAQSLQVPAGCVAEATEGIAASSPASSPPSASPAATPPVFSARITLFDLGYRPCALELPADTPVAITFDNIGIAVGNFVVDELGVRGEVSGAGQTTQVMITAPAGTFAFYSEVPGQREAGRAGVLVVGDGDTPAPGTPERGTPVA